jgi:4-hydroxy-tetrahydrodipicolinate synthase
VGTPTAAAPGSAVGGDRVEGYGRVITAMVTPFDRHGQVDYRRAAALAQRLCEAGSDGFVVAGTTGEAPTLTSEEKLRLCEAVREAVDGRAFVWLNTGNYNTQESVDLTRRAERAGAQGEMAVVPYYNKPPQEGLYRHFRAIAAATELPVMIYNVPSRTSCNVLPRTLARLAEIENVVAVKEASSNMAQVAEIRQLTPPRFSIYSGNDGDTLPILALGGAGVVSVASHLAAREIREMVNAFLAGDGDRARSIHQRLMPLFQVLFITTNPIPVKVALRLAGFDVGGFRLPLVEPSEAEEAEIRHVLSRLELSVA